MTQISLQQPFGVHSCSLLPVRCNKSLLLIAHRWQAVGKTRWSCLPYPCARCTAARNSSGAGVRPVSAPVCGCRHESARFSVQFPHPGRQGLGCINRCHTQIRDSSSHCSAICDFLNQIRSKACLVREPHAWRAPRVVSVVQRMNNGVWLGLMSHCGS